MRKLLFALFLLASPLWAQEKRFIPSSGSETSVLPAASDPIAQSRNVFIQNTGTGTVTISAAGGRIDALPSIVLAAGRSSYFISDGVDWWTLGFSSSGGGGAPAGAEYIVAELHADLSAEVAPSADDQIPVSDSATAATWRSIPNCGEAGTLNYDTATNAFSCLTDAGAAGATNSVEVSIDLGATGGLVFSATVAAAWVAAGSEIVCTPFATNADGLTVETVYASGVQAVTSNKVAGVSFDLTVYSPHGATGIYRIHCLGV